ncbi:MAG: HNH endonuclease [Ignavibacteria bacterium CG2_30_36_16]|nr:MAG: HNH endonuclease [Ignavibacteria bacterium CG2_30_36_16]PJB01146.1 MAG: HNH endonuclease [Ignavibacteria bacterium CG_4_9_14_3_um_filter_36_18]
MNIELKEIRVSELTSGYEDNQEGGVIGFGGKLDIRPPYQREFIYKDKQRDAVIDTITKEFPLNVMYWAVREDGNFEVVDGQQRTISLCQFVDGDFAFNNRYFHNLQNDEREQILNYKLMIYLCSGADSEKLEWFKTINIAGEKLTDQELRNAVYSGPWVSDAKRYFSKNGCATYELGGDYLNGSAIRQDYLETTIKWISNDAIEHYMAENQHEPNANEIWLYFQSVINWVKTVFPKYRREMKGIDWGFLNNEFKNQKFDSKKLEEEIAKLMEDEDVGSKKGIYTYVLTHKEKHLNIRAFSPNQKREAYERQKGICVVCKEHFEIDGMEADHITPWREGGKTSAGNCQMLCKEDNRRKSGN